MYVSFVSFFKISNFLYINKKNSYFINIYLVASCISMFKYAYCNDSLLKLIYVLISKIMK